MKLREAKLLLLGALLLATSCGGGAKAGGASDGQPRPASPAKVTIVEPGAGAEISGPELHVKISLEGARIIPQATKTIKPDEGHLHLSLDGELASMTYGQEQDLQVTPGNHILQAEFVAGDHAPFNPRVIVVRSFTVR